MEKRKTSAIGVRKGKVSIGVYFRQYGTRATVAELCCKIRLSGSEHLRKVFKGKSWRMVSENLTDEFDAKTGRSLAFERSMKGVSKIEKKLMEAKADLERKAAMVNEMIDDLRSAKTEIFARFESFERDGILDGREYDNTTGHIVIKPQAGPVR